MTLNLGFRSPYGYAISMLIVDYDYFVRIQKTLQRKNLLSDEQARAVLSAMSRAILGVFYGTACGGLVSVLRNHINHLPETRPNLLGEPAARYNPFAVSMVMLNATAGTLSNKFKIHGPSRSFVSSCTSSTVAIVVSPGKVVMSAPCAQPRRTLCSGVSPVSNP